MQNQKQGFWTRFSLLVSAAVLCLIGALLGKFVMGVILFWLGLAVVLAGFVYIFVKTDDFKNGRLRPLILGLILSMLLSSSGVLVLGNSGGNISGANSLSSALRRASRSMGGSSSSSYGNYSRSGNSGSFQGNSGTNGTFSNRSGSNGFGTGGSGYNGFSGNGGFSQGGFSSSNHSSSGTASNSGSINYSQVMKRVVSTLFGYLFLLIGGIMLLIIVISLLTKKLVLRQQRWQTMILGLLVGSLLAASFSLLITGSASAASNYRSMAAGGSMGTPQARFTRTMMPLNGGQETPTQAATATITPTQTPYFTATPQPTFTSTIEVLSSLVVCLDYNIQIGANIRSFPTNDANPVGTIPPAGCFTINGQSADHPGWYHLESGQNGIEGITIRPGADQESLWVNGDHFSIDRSKLDLLPNLQLASGK
jgi:hypothetical protein